MPRLSSQRERGTRGERGNVVITVALMAAMLMGFAALVVDLGNAYRVRGELQNAADAAALAGAMELDGTATGISSATDKVKEFAQKHFANSSIVFVAENDIEFGHWSFVNDDGSNCAGPSCFTKITDFTSSAGAVNAVRVTTRRDGESDAANDKQVKFFFGVFLNRSEGKVNTQAVAVGGGPATGCGFPLTIPRCQLDNPSVDVDGNCLWNIIFQNDKNDNACASPLSSPGQCGGSSNQPIYELIESACGGNGQLITGGRCENCTQGPIAGEKIELCNGVQMNKNNWCGLIQNILMRGKDVKGTGDVDTAQSFKVEVPIIDSGSLTYSNCGEFKCATDKKEVVGYATLEIFGIKCGSSEPCVYDKTAGENCTGKTGPAGDVILAKLSCKQNASHHGGGGYFGTDAPHVRLVR